jgi:microcystin degradation protein MlrC
MQRILVVKAAIAYKAAYASVAGTIIEVDTPGLTAVNPERFAYRHIRRPMFPLDRSDNLSAKPSPFNLDFWDNPKDDEDWNDA